MRLRIMGLVIVGLWMGPHASAVSIGDAVGLGLESLQWGMPIDEVSRLYPSMTTASVRGKEYIAADARFVNDYRYAGCTFEIGFYFVQNRLEVVRLISLGDPEPCRTQIKDELQRQYSTITPITPLSSSVLGVNWRWIGPDTTVDYGYIFIRRAGFNHGPLVGVTFQRTGGPGLMHYLPVSPPPPAQR